MSSRGESLSSYEEPPRVKRDRSPIRKTKSKIVESNFDTVVFRCLLEYCNPYFIWVMANICKHWRLMIKTFLGPRLTSVCKAWRIHRLSYAQVSIFYNFYQYKFISLDSYEILREENGFARADFYGTCLAPYAISVNKSRCGENTLDHADWIELIKTRKTGVEVKRLLGEILSVYPSYSTLKHILLKVAANTKLNGDKLIPLHVMFTYHIPAKLIEAYYKKLVKHRTENVFASHRMVGYGMEDLDYFVAIRSVVQPLFPQQYMRALRTVILNTPVGHSDIDRNITVILESHDLFAGETSRFVWLSEFAVNYKSNLSDAQLERFMPVFNDYCAVTSSNPATQLKIVIHSHQLMLCMFKSQHNFWAPKFFLWFLSDSNWFGRRCRFQLLAYLRDNPTVIPWIFDSIGPYLRTLRGCEQRAAEQNLAVFIRHMMDAETWMDKLRWENTERIVKKFFTVVDPISLRKLVGLIYYPHAPPSAFLIVDCDLASTDPDVIRYNFLKILSTRH